MNPLRSAVRPFAALLTGLLLATAASAQTTGVPFVNDYTINGLGSGTTSCNPIPLGPGLVPFTVTSDPNLPVVYFASLCPCSPCSLPLPSASCAIPATACFGSNQSIDLALNAACPLIAWPGVTDGSGVCTVMLPITGTPTFSTQAVILNHPTCPSALGLIVTQSHQVN